MHTIKEKQDSFERLLNIMDELRAKCPWDKEQTMESIRNLSVEEVYELGDAILKNDVNEIKKELGDVFLHLVFYSKIASEKGWFDVKDVLDAICDKLIFRHPHVFGTEDVDNNTTKVLQNWEDLKKKEGSKSTLQGVPQSLPALIKANRIQEKARAVGFDWEQKEQVWDKVQEEISELMHEIKNFDKEKTEQEFGDLLFSIVNAGRLYGIDPETALEKTNRKFLKRFNYLEFETTKQGKSLRNMSLAEMDVIWNEAKKLD